MQVMPLMLRVIFLVFASVICGASLLHWLGYLRCFSIINISFKDISFKMNTTVKSPSLFRSNPKKNMMPRYSIANTITINHANPSSMIVKQTGKKKASNILLIYSVRFMMWYPNLVLTGAETWPFSSSKAVFSNSLTILPLVNVPRSPPFLPEGHSDTCCAMAPNFSPLSRRALTFLASVSVLTNIWQQCTLSGIVYSWWYGLLSFS
jgi:hypothetical protein